MGGFFRGLKNILDFGGVLPKIAGAFGLPDPLGDMLEEPEGPEAPAAAVEEAPTRTDDAAVAKAGADAREEAQRRRGRRATILSSRQDRKKATLGKRGVLGG